MSDPMTADQLIRAFTAEKLHIKQYKNWRTHNRAGHGGWGPLNGVMMHHTAALNALDVIYNGRADLRGPLAQHYIDKAGTVWMTGHGRANHAGGGDPRVLAAVVAENYGARPPAPHQHEGSNGAVDGNSHFYGFECENLGTGDDPWPHEQYVAMVKAAAAICRFHKWSAKSCIGHKEWSDWKPDPKGFGMVTFRIDLAACLRAKPGAWPAPAK
jgi:hypothetical protein